MPAIRGVNVVTDMKPVGDESVAQFGWIVGKGDVAVAFEASNCSVGLTCAQLVERKSFLEIVLASVHIERDDGESFHKCAEQSAGFDFGQLLRVADYHEAGTDG